jgi:hypothetical protein
VDDKLLTKNDDEECKTSGKDLAHEFEMKDLESLKYFLGI